MNPTLNFFKERASEMLRTETGAKLRKRRSIDVETVFGNIKRNLGFTRFTLRGLEKVTLEWRLVATGHNIRKLFLAESRKTGQGQSHRGSFPCGFEARRLSLGLWAKEKSGGCAKITFDTAP